MKKKIFAVILLSAMAVITASVTGGINAAEKDNVIWLVKPQLDKVYNFFEGTAAVGKGSKFYGINRNGEDVNSKNIFYEGLAIGSEYDKQGFINYGYKNNAGKFVIKPQFADAERFKGGLAKAAIRVQLGNVNVLKYGFINKSGVFITKPEYDELSDFYEGFAAVKKFNMWGFIDKNGRVVIKPQFSRVGNFSEGLAAVKVDKEWGYIDKEGKFVIEPQFEWGCEFSGGLAKVKEGEDEWGFINRSGKFVIKPKFAFLYDFQNGLALFNSDKNVKCGYINREGKIVIEDVGGEEFSEGVAKVYKNGRTGIINTKGEFVFETTGYSIYNISEGLFRIYKDGRYGFVDKNGIVIIQPQFEDANDFVEGCASVKINGKWGFIKNPVPAKKQEESLEQGGMLIGVVKTVSKSEIVIEYKNIPGNIREDDALCLFSGDAIVVLRSTSDINPEFTCEVMSGSMKGIKPGMKVFRYKKIIETSKGYWDYK